MSRSVIAALVLLIVVSAWIGSGFLSDSQDASSAATSQSQDDAASPAKLPTVQVQQVTASSVDRILNLMGVTAANREVRVPGQTKGTIARLNVESGVMVNQGALLAEIDIGDRYARAEEARAMVTLRQSEYDAAVKLAEKNLQSPTDLTRAQTNLDAARAGLATAELEISRTKIRAPFSGVVEERFVEIGDYVDIGQSIVHLLDLSKIKVLGQVSERDVGRVRVGMPATLTFVEGQTIVGEVTFVSQSSDSATRTFGIEVTAVNQEGKIASGMTARISLNLGQAQAHRLSPAVLTLDDEGRIGVKIVDQNDLVQFMPVELITDSPDGMWLAGLPMRADLITVGHEFVSAGQRVAVRGRDQ